MIAVDTNVIVRLLTQDDPIQFKRAYKLFDSQELFLPDTVILETEWVLRYAYEFSPEQINKALARLFGLSNVHLNIPSVVARAIEWHKQGMDFSDAFHLASSQDCQKLTTFDRKFINKAQGLGSCAVVEP